MRNFKDEGRDPDTALAHHSEDRPRAGLQRVHQHGEWPAPRAHPVLVELQLLVATQGNPPPRQTGPDPVGVAIDARLGIVYEGSQTHLVFEKLSLAELLDR